MSSDLDDAAWAELRTDVAAMPPGLREEAATAWASDAQLEHASIASFSRFSLELLAVAAPPSLVEAAHRAALEELGHARLCFGLASAYRGVALGPGPLPLDRKAFQNFDLVTAARNTTVEGCINETLAALEAEAAAANATPRVVRAVLTRISREEASHASLAFQFVSWALAAGGAPVRHAIIEGVEGFLAAARSAPVPLPSEGSLAAHGRLTKLERYQLRQRSLRDVLEPAIRHLLNPPAK